ncbi:diguanylate cyclase [Candidatus Woesearchaeota archaeon]|nr:diguanylate cyclase [Candidatus Woesearchaeota archaeon]
MINDISASRLEQIVNLVKTSPNPNKFKNEFPQEEQEIVDFYQGFDTGIMNIFRDFEPHNFTNIDDFVSDSIMNFESVVNHKTSLHILRRQSRRGLEKEQEYKLKFSHNEENEQDINENTIQSKVQYLKDTGIISMLRDEEYESKTEKLVYEHALKTFVSTLEKNIRAIYSNNMDDTRGVFNKNATRRHLEGIDTRAKDENLSYGLLFFDIDDFGDENKRIGHIQADEKLGQIGQILNKKSRGGDLIGSYGGDEYVVAIVGANQEIMETIFNKISCEIFMDTGLSITGGYHIVQVGDNNSLDNNLDNANTAMYVAKGSKGFEKDRVIEYIKGMVPPLKT